MSRHFFPVFGVALFALCGCADSAVKPSPTSDQVMMEQYRARGDQSAMSGPEINAIADTYRQQIGKPAQAPQSNIGESRGDQ
ncbi:MAG: hypothetical protein V4559_15410 [Pseudomonadota bacterium]